MGLSNPTWPRRELGFIGTYERWNYFGYFDMLRKRIVRIRVILRSTLADWDDKKSGHRKLLDFWPPRLVAAKLRSCLAWGGVRRAQASQSQPQDKWPTLNFRKLLLESGRAFDFYSTLICFDVRHTAIVMGSGRSYNTDDI